MKARRCGSAALLMIAAPALAQEEPRFCPTNPSLESSACTTAPGRVHVELTALDWQLDRSTESRTDTFLAADTLVRLGVGPATEVQFDWSPYGQVREREAGEAVRRRNRVGDVTLAVRQNLRNPDGKGLSYGIQPFVTLPVGRRPVGDGTWSAGAIVPITYDLTDTVNIGTTWEVDAMADEDGHGRHFAGDVVVAASFDLTDALGVTTEMQVTRDDDPAGASTQLLAGVGTTWKVAKTRAFYAEALAGLNHETPDVRLYAGWAALF